MEFKPPMPDVGDAYPLAQALEDGIRAVLEWVPPPPCGSEKRPHLTAPTPDGKPARCATCGDIVIVLADGRCVLYRP